MHGIGDEGALAGLRDRAAAIAATWGATAATTTTVGQERAILRLFGVHGIDRAGRPLAGEVVDRYIAPDPRRLGGGIALPFAIAMEEYDRSAQEVALEVAAGNIDLGLEAELLADPERRAVAVARATRLSLSALERVDANRVARLELLDLLGDTPMPWVGIEIAAPAIVDALDEARLALGAGVDLIRVGVPPSRELTEGMARLGRSVEEWRAEPSSRGGLDASDTHGAPVPTGSQRALAVLRRFADEAGARRRGYVRILTDSQPLAAPDQAVVAAFERIDGVIADPMLEIVTGRVHPDRAIADHVFAHRLLCRAGTRILVPAGPLLVAPDLATGVPSDAPTRSGRALALQLLAVALARRDGLPAGSVCVGVLPDWLVDEPAAPARAAAELALRRALFPEQSLSFAEPVLEGRAALTWQAIVAAILPAADGVDMILRRATGAVGELAASTAEAAAVAKGLRSSREPSALAGVALDHATRSMEAAHAMLAALEEGGWRAFVDQPLGLPAPVLGAEAVASRTEAFDPLSAVEPVRE